MLAVIMWLMIRHQCHNVLWICQYYHLLSAEHQHCRELVYIQLSFNTK